ncbi:D-alanyl-D-alanine carboxypeptidase/D-alanyl-D-alanine endopeptidase [Streptomyces benahoarensis]|uniref:D-alanyl-D-alanine carboxypeptidase/D-alanyl-D-alanine-endopeptidase n=1 Tax=Streptomyces benahoarensis TaxID=2595054 RepID=A0A553ZN10_9ACTN|nr:D-alanyl-D-alanine carboxypeptidase/D-alanyl-D-alanine-endopeptidase [Streptomyces benahoarensis]TSB29797.1 D-alanyl-D-alanine carboxypeptidase/D-alanyl-D-alanine-endopeptidase [Streptomyces benahoarensis]TSB42830.1 D-alanyl-D-alanine carboxypeptidase/D-alanyl-D-alanine-endopeptidase [Streptomyces benahoarensis]
MPETGSWQVGWETARRSARAYARAAARTAQRAGHEVRRTWRAAPPRTRSTWRLTAVATAAGLAAATAAVAVAGPWDSGQRTAERARAGAAAGTGGAHHGGARGRGGAPGGADGGPGLPQVLPALGIPAADASGRGAAPQPTGAGLADALSPLLKDKALGALRTASVIDVATGRQVFAAKPTAAVVPASTVKLATAVAALTTLGADHRIETTVVTAADAADDGKGAGEGKHPKGGKDDERPKGGKDAKDSKGGEDAKDDGKGGKSASQRIVLVGGGDPTLTARASKGGADGSASLRALADDTARALAERGRKKVSLGYDTSLYSGPAVHPIGPNENLARVTPLMADEGRLDDSDSGPAPRAADPSADAARAFAARLKERGIDVDGAPSAAHAPKDATRLATVRSQPLGALVERMLTNSDNDIAEALARQTALGAHRPASFSGAGTAVRQTLAAQHLPLSGSRFDDGSGLDRDDKVSAELLARLLLHASAPERPELRPIVTGLPVAAFTGTLDGRYADTAGAGAVRAKTGTLTGVNTLAGTVVDADGRLLVFAFMTNGTSDAQGAQKALDTLASAVANCGCR